MTKLLVLILSTWLAVSASAQSPLIPSSGGGITSGSTLVICSSGTTGVLFNNGGAVNCGLNFTFDGATTLGLGTNIFISAPAAATLQFGAADGATPVAQKLKFQSGAGTNIAGVNTTITGSLSTGTGNDGNICFQTGVKNGMSGTTPATATNALCMLGETQQVQLAAGTASLPILTFNNETTTGFYSVAANTTGYANQGFLRFYLNFAGLIASVGGGPIMGVVTSSATVPTFNPNGDALAGIGGTAGNVSIIANNSGVATEMIRATGTLVSLPTISSDATHTDASVCEDTTTHALYSGSGTLGICLGTSGRQFKRDLVPMTAGLDDVLRLKLWDYRYRPGYGDGGARLQRGPTAQDVEEVLPDLVGRNEAGEIINYDIGAWLPIALRSIQQLSAEVNRLKGAVK